MSTATSRTSAAGLVDRLGLRLPQRPVWSEREPILLTVAKVVVLGLAVLAILAPLWMIIVTSVSPERVVNQTGGLVLVPRGFTLAAYEKLFSGGIVLRSVGVSVFITVVGTALALAVTIMGAYAVAKPTMRGHRPLLFFILMTMFFSGGIIPTYLLVSQLGLIDSLWALILPHTISAFNLVIMRTFFMGLDQDLLDAARIDGAGEWRILLSLVVPMSKPVIAVIGLFYGVGFWNAFFNALIYINDNSKYPLQLILRSYVIDGNQMAALEEAGAVITVPPITLQMAIVVIAVIPIMVVYPFLQKHFRTGVLIGAVKG